MMPADIRDQYRRNLRRASASVATALVRVTKRELSAPSGSAARETAIFTNPGSSNAANSSGGRGRNSTSWRHGSQ